MQFLPRYSIYAGWIDLMRVPDPSLGGGIVGAPLRKDCINSEPLWPAACGQKRTLRAFQTNSAVHGRIILISVNSPGFVSTSIKPACCLTMMSWLIERPRPVPSPVGFVVKNGSNIFFHVGRNTGAVIADPDFHAITKVSGRSCESRFVV